LEEMDLGEFSELIKEDVYEVLSVESTLGAKCAVGGTARANVDEALEEARQRF